MNVSVDELSKMSRRERNRTLAKLADAATAHRDTRPFFSRVVDAVREFLSLPRIVR